MKKRLTFRLYFDSKHFLKFPRISHRRSSHLNFNIFNFDWLWFSAWATHEDARPVVMA